MDDRLVSGDRWIVATSVRRARLAARARPQLRLLGRLRSPQRA